MQHGGRELERKSEGAWRFADFQCLFCQTAHTPYTCVCVCVRACVCLPLCVEHEIRVLTRGMLTSKRW
jgi:hypothetical protein